MAQQVSLPKKRGLALAGSALSAAFLLAVPVFAITTVLADDSGLFGGVVIQSSDDPVANGLRIVDQEPAPPAGSASRKTADDPSGEIILKQWRYTRDKHGSPGK
jgi:hypothetical protein